MKKKLAVGPFKSYAIFREGKFDFLSESVIIFDLSWIGQKFLFDFLVKMMVNL